MNKELEALERIKKYLYPVKIEETDIIETALKDYEETDNQIYDLFEKFEINNSKDLLRQLRAFEIIKEKEIDIPLLKESDNVEDYNYWCHPDSQLELEPYTLLKEMLKNERL